MNDPFRRLSAAGEQRREAILAAALREAQRRRRERHEWRAVGAGLGTAAILLLALVFHPTPDGEHSPGRGGTASGVPEPRRGGPEQLVQIFPPDPTATARLAVRDAAPTWELIGDEEVIAGLSEAGAAGGLLQINGEAQLVLRER